MAPNPDQALSINECMAARFLHADGYSTEDIGLFLQVRGANVSEHVNRRCSHVTVADPVDWEAISGDELHSLRAEENLTQTDVADEVGVAMGTVQRWESGETEPTPQNAMKLLALFDRLPETTTPEREVA